MALHFVAGTLPPGFERRVVTVLPGERRGYDPAEWRGAIVVVERGEIVLEGLDGSRRRFGPGDVLAFDRVSLLALHNAGRVPVVLVAVARRSREP